MARTQRLEQAKVEDASKPTEDCLPAHNFRTLLDDLATLTYDVCHTALNSNAKIVMTIRPTPVQEKAFCLLNLGRPVSSNRPGLARITP